MQLIWLSGPTANVVSFSIGRKTILMGLAALATILVALGGILQLMGIRIAVDARPDLARALGGVTSASEQERIASHYEQQIAQLRSRIDGLSDVVVQLESAKRAIVELVPAPNRSTFRLGGQGGPLRRLIEFEWFAPLATDGLVKLDSDAGRLDHQVQALMKTWTFEAGILRALPLKPPLSVEHQVSSGFGFRRDPFGGGWGRHEGLDFVASPGTGIQATADGVVSQADVQGPYGLAVDIDHGRGFSTRYAHLSKIEVKSGERVQAGQVIGLLGNSGRSTGPHLHYEVRLNGQAIDPVVDSVLKAAKTQIASDKLASAR